MKLPTLGRRASDSRAAGSVAAVVAIVALFLLAASLTNLELGPGQDFILPELSLFEPGAPAPWPEMGTGWFLVCVLLTVAVAVAALLVMLRSREDRKQLLRILGWGALYLAVGLLVANLVKPEEMDEERTGQQQPAESPVTILTEPEEPGMPVAFTPPEVPTGIGTLITLLIVLVAGGLGYWLWQQKHPPEAEIEVIARSALDDLRMGRDWEDVVIRCYADMNTAVSQRRGLTRHQAMTPSEFAVRLEQAGLPAHSVRSLTRLFEQARYSSRSSSTGEVQQAIDCLSAIMQAVERRA
jgi:hypothetical protein